MQALEIVGDGVVILDSLGSVLALNKAAEDIYGRTRDELLGVSISKLVYPSARASEVQKWFETLDANISETPGSIVGFIERPDGSKLPVEVIPRISRYKNETVIAASIRDISKRVEIEETLARERRRWGKLIESGVASSTIINADGTIQFESPTLRGFLGFSSEYMTGKQALDFAHPTEMKGLLSEFNRLLEDPDYVCRYTGRFRHFDGSWRFLEITAKNMLSDPDVIGVAAHAQDVTEKMRAVEEAKASEELLKQAQAIGSIGIWSVNYDNNKLEWSGPFEEIFGYKLEDIEYSMDEFFNRIYPEDFQPTLELVIDAINTKTAHIELNYRVLRPDNTFRFIQTQASLIMDDKGNVTGLHGVSRDNTDAAQAIADLTNNQERLRAAQNLARCGFWSMNLIDEKVFYSEELLNLMKFDEASMPRDMSDIRKRMSPGDGEAAQLAIEHSLTTGEPLYFEYQMQIGDDKWLWLQNRGEIIRNSDGDPVRIDGVALDVQKAKEAELELQRARITADEANQAKSAFLANMSHELRTPLNAIIGFSDLLETLPEDKKPPERVNEYISLINSSGRHLLSLIADILDVSKIESGKIEPRPVWVKIDAIVLQSLGLVGQTEDEINPRVIFKQGKQPVWLWVDPRHLQQILTNLIKNAMKFSTRTESVEVEALVETSGDLEIEIRDKGRGMSEKDIEIALEPFAQVDDVLTKQVEGTGLGLPIAKELTTMNKGSLEILSLLNTGTTVRLMFPKNLVSTNALHKESQQQ